jgi:hypothetical protein
MKLSQLAAKPQLIKLSLDDKSIIKEHGEAIDFWTWDRQPLEIFMRLASVDQKNMGALIDVTRELILEEDGSPIIKDGVMLPTSLLIAAIAKITDTLGK